jgi:hypothetical protein
MNLTLAQYRSQASVVEDLRLTAWDTARLTWTTKFISKKGKIIAVQAWTGPWGSRRFRLPEFSDNRHMNVVWLSVLRTGRLYSPEKIPGTHFCYRLSPPQGHSATGRIKSTNNFNDPNGNRTRDLSACSAVPLKEYLETQFTSHRKQCVSITKTNDFNSTLTIPTETTGSVFWKSRENRTCHSLIERHIFWMWK